MPLRKVSFWTICFCLSDRTLAPDPDAPGYLYRVNPLHGLFSLAVTTISAMEYHSMYGTAINGKLSVVQIASLRTLVLS